MRTVHYILFHIILSVCFYSFLVWCLVNVLYTVCVVTHTPHTLTILCIWACVLGQETPTTQTDAEGHKGTVYGTLLKHSHICSVNQTTLSICKPAKGRRWTYWWPAVSFLQEVQCQCYYSETASENLIKLWIYTYARTHFQWLDSWWWVYFCQERGEEGSQREERLMTPLGTLKSLCSQRWVKVKDDICVCVCAHVCLIRYFDLISKSLQSKLKLKSVHMQNICLRRWDREDPRSRPDEFRH